MTGRRSSRSVDGIETTVVRWLHDGHHGPSSCIPLTTLRSHGNSQSVHPDPSMSRQCSVGDGGSRRAAITGSGEGLLAHALVMSKKKAHPMLRITKRSSVEEQRTWVAVLQQCTANSPLYSCGGIDHATYGAHNNYYDHATGTLVAITTSIGGTCIAGPPDYLPPRCTASMERPIVCPQAPLPASGCDGQCCPGNVSAFTPVWKPPTGFNQAVCGRLQRLNARGSHASRTVSYPLAMTARSSRVFFCAKRPRVMARVRRSRTTLRARASSRVTAARRPSALPSERRSPTTPRPWSGFSAEAWSATPE